MSAARGPKIGNTFKLEGAVKRYFDWRVVGFCLSLLALSVSASVWASLESGSSESVWLVDYIDRVPPILIKEPFLELLGQNNQPIPYSYKEAVKLTGHSCAAVAGAWIMTRKALEALYPDTLPVRGQIKVMIPGTEDEWFVGIFGQVITYVTGAAPKTGFPGAEFGQAFNRRNLMDYREKPSGTPPPKMVWIFERTDTQAKVSVTYDLSRAKPSMTPEESKMGSKIANGQATPGEAKQWRENWNARAQFVLENGDRTPGVFTVEKPPSF
jgi:hypothetical protein